jgi:energy-coupling factor transport system ATP-binding protein
VFSNLNFTLRKDKTLSIIGPSGSGKTTLLRILNGELPYEGKIVVSNIGVSNDNFEELRSKIAVVYNNNEYFNELVKDELRFSLENLNISPKEIKERIGELDEFFGIKKIFNKPIEILSINDKILVKILSYAIYYPEYLAIDDLLIYLNERTKILLLNYLNYKNIKLIMVTSNVEDTLFTDYTLVLYNKINAIDGKTLEVLKEEKILKRLGLNIPFYLDLSIQLKLYGLINKTYLNKEDLVKHLWK